VRFTPGSTGLKTAALHIASNDPTNGLFNIALTGTGTNAAAPLIVVQQPAGTSLVNNAVTNNFGSVIVGTNTSHTFTITNIGGANLTISNVTIDGVDSTMFTVTNFIATVSPGGSTNFTVNFAPTNTGVQISTLHIASNDPTNGLFNIVLTGMGTNAAVPVIGVQQPLGTNLTNSVSTKNFGLAAVGTGTSLTFTITNIGTANLTVSNITIGGANLTSFTVTNLTATVSPGGSTNFTMRFAPVSTGAKTATLHIANNDTNNNPFNIAVTGMGIDSAIVVSTNISVVPEPSPLSLNPQTGLFTNSVLLTNNSPNPIPAVRLYILNLQTNVQVYYASGSTTNGTPYVQYNFPLAPGATVAPAVTVESVESVASLAPGATVNFTIEYYEASRQPIPIPTYVPQDTTPVTLTSTTNSPVARYIRASGGGYLIGFYTTPGRSYAVQYSTDMINWLTADPLIKAPINHVQWIDFGAPKTQGPLPLTRFYRVFEQP
jgi:hypothetical protein